MVRVPILDRNGRQMVRVVAGPGGRLIRLPLTWACRDDATAERMRDLLSGEESGEALRAERIAARGTPSRASRSATPTSRALQPRPASEPISPPAPPAVPEIPDAELRHRFVNHLLAGLTRAQARVALQMTRADLDRLRMDDPVWWIRMAVPAQGVSDRLQAKRWARRRQERSATGAAS